MHSLGAVLAGARNTSERPLYDQPHLTSTYLLS